MLSNAWRAYLAELTAIPLLGPGLDPNLSPKVRRILHFFFTTVRYLIIFFVFKPLSWLLMHSICDLRLYGKENLPRPEQGCIATGNHLSQLDTLLFMIYTPKPGFVMAKTEYFKTPVMGGVATLAGGFPVRRGEADRQAVRTALSVVKRGGILGIYPEGTRSKTFTLQPGHAGAAMIAATSGSLVWPLSVWGTENLMRRTKWGFLKRPRVEVMLGKPYSLKEEAVAFATLHGLVTDGKRNRHSDLEFLSDIMMLKIAENLPPAYRGEFTPSGVVARYQARRVEQGAGDRG